VIGQNAGLQSTVVAQTGVDMKRPWSCLYPIFAAGIAVVGLISFAGEGSPTTGAETEKRFPPLRVPEKFQATLFACDPLIEYP
jgi:hypothetical protein